MERNEHAATVERLRRLNRNGYAVRAEFAVGSQESLLGSMNQQLAIRQALVNEQKELNEQLDALVASGDIAEYTDTWLKWKTEINDVATSIVEADSALEELK